MSGNACGDSSDRNVTVKPVKPVMTSTSAKGTAGVVVVAVVVVVPIVADVDALVDVSATLKAAASEIVGVDVVVTEEVVVGGGVCVGVGSNSATRLKFFAGIRNTIF